MRANRPIGLISRDYIPIECIQNCEALFRSTCFGKSGGISSLPADCRRYADQLRRTEQSLSTQHGGRVPVQHVPTELPLPVENVLGAHIWTPLRDSAPPLLLQGATTVSDPARKEERNGPLDRAGRRAALHSGA